MATKFLIDVALEINAMTICKTTESFHTSRNLFVQWKKIEKCHQY